MFLFTRERKPRSVAVFCLLWPFRPYFVAFIAFHFLFFISRPDIDGIGRNGKGENEKENFKKISEEKKNERNVRVDVGKHPPEVTTFFLVFFVCFFTKHEAITFGTEPCAAVATVTFDFLGRKTCFVLFAGTRPATGFLF